MKINKKIIAVALLAGSVSTIYLLPSGFLNPFMDGNEGISKSIRESKLRGVFVAEYYSPQEVQVINDSIILHVKEAWLEQSWYYKLFALARPHNEWYQLCMVVDEQDLHNYSEVWTIGYIVDHAKDKMFMNYEISANQPITPYLACEGKSFSDKETFDVVRWINRDAYDVEKLGVFTLLKK